MTLIFLALIIWDNIIMMKSLSLQIFSECGNGPIKDLIGSCDFKKRLEKCNIKSIVKKKEIGFYFYISDWSVLAQKSALILLILNIAVSIICFITNLIIMIILLNKKTSKEFIKSYKYLIIHTCFNSLYVLISLFDLICNRDRVEHTQICNTEFVQYFKLISFRFIGSVLKTASNISHVSFTLSRYIVMTNTKSKILQKFNMISIKKFLLITILFCVVVNLYFCFQFIIRNQSGASKEIGFFNYNYSSMYKEEKIDDYRQDFTFSEHILLNFLQYIRIIFSDTFYIIISFLIDTFLFLFVKKQMKRKQKMFFINLTSNQFRNQISVIRANRLAKTSKSRITSLIILNGINFLIFRFPSAVFNFYALIYFYDKTKMEYNPSLIGYLFCRVFMVCQRLAELCHLVYMISFLIQFFIMFKLDKNFKESFLNLILLIKFQ